MSSIDYARDYYKWGWLPIPLKKNSKAPALPKGHEFLRRRPTREEFASFDWSGNVGIVCGELSGITVLDVDLPDGAETLEKLDMTLPHTVQAKTPHGMHYFLQYDERVKTGVAVLGAGVDIRNDASFVVAPGSVIDGKEYRWHLSTEEVEMEKPPSWMMQGNGRRVNNAKVDLSKRLGDGERNNGLSSIAGKLLYGGTMDEGLVYNVLSLCNQQLCDPPLDEWEVEHIFKSIRRYHYN